MRRALSLAAAALIAGCASGAQPDANGTICNAFHGGRSHVEAVATGTVSRVLGTQPGLVSPHEGFLMRLDGGCTLVVRVEANTDFTGEFPLADGERVEVKGEYEYYARGGVLHWTHRDPRGRHEGGYITAGGKTYE